MLFHALHPRYLQGESPALNFLISSPCLRQQILPVAPPGQKKSLSASCICREGFAAVRAPALVESKPLEILLLWKFG